MGISQELEKKGLCFSGGVRFLSRFFFLFLPIDEINGEV
jgi:hypothetical protein